MTLEERIKLFAEKIRVLMKENGLSFTKLSNLSGVPRETISSWLNRGSNPNIDALSKIAVYFQCSVDFLIGLEDEFGGKLY